VSTTTLILPRYLVPVRPRGLVLEDHAVVLNADRIENVLPADQALSKYSSAQRIILSGHALIPGLMNMHTHSAMSLLRGYADDLDLQVWLNEHIWPAEKRWMGPEFVRDGVRLAMAEMIRGGTTFFNDNYFFPEVTAEAASEAGMRAMIGLPVIDVATAWAEDLDTYISKGIAVHANLESDSLITTAFAPHAPYTVQDESLRRIAHLARELDIPVHKHILETEWEIRHSLEYHGVRPLQRLQQLDLLNSRLLAVHMTQLTDEDVVLLAETGVKVIHCPESNLKLASGVCPVQSLLDAGVTVAIGTDGAASNNDLDLLGEGRTAALLAKGISGDPKAVGGLDTLDMMTIAGATAMGRQHELGSIEPGKQADLCAIDLDEPMTQPVHNVISQLVYAASSRQVSDVWVAGRRLLKDGELTCMDKREVLDRARIWNERLEAGHQ
jgi:5-methylthioadenosine/S-adenosylhomocysteine deaminase